jgi:uncharacterized protein
VTSAPLDLYTCFDGHRRLASGPLQTVSLTLKHAVESGSADPVLIFSDTTGRSIDIDTRGSDQDVLARLAQANPAQDPAEAAHSERPLDSALDTRDTESPANPPRGRGRPKLGVVAREVTLLPRHWEWLAAQPGGASVALRKLVEDARKTRNEKDQRRITQERAYHFMSAMAGDMPNFEEASRALFAGDQTRLHELIAAWPEDVRDHAIALASEDSPR